MNKVLLSALLLAALAASAGAQNPLPLNNQLYHCYYYYPGGLVLEGTSRFALNGGRGIEYFRMSLNLSQPEDNRKVTFAKPVPYQYGVSWEYTINPQGPQCKDTRVTYDSTLLLFRNCTDGHVRDCFLW